MADARRWRRKSSASPRIRYAHLGRIDDYRDTVLARLLAGRMSKGMRIFGLWTVPADSTTSSAVILSRPLSMNSTPNGPLVLDEDANNGLAGEKGHAAQREMLSASLESIPLLVRGLMDSGHVFRTTRNDGATSTLLRLRPSGTSSACPIRSISSLVR